MRLDKLEKCYYEIKLLLYYFNLYNIISVFNYFLYNYHLIFKNIYSKLIYLIYSNKNNTSYFKFRKKIFII